MVVKSLWARRVRHLQNSVRQDRLLVTGVPKSLRILFLLTNLPYFAVAAYIYIHDSHVHIPGEHYFEMIGLHFCGSSLWLAAGVFAIAVASSSMHFSQMKLFDCTRHAHIGNQKGGLKLHCQTDLRCLCSVYAEQTFIMLKHMDVFCVVYGVLSALFCCGIWQVLWYTIPISKSLCTFLEFNLS